MARKSSGIPGLDKLIEGGFPDGAIVLYSGAPGTGKTIAAMQFIAEGMKKGEKCAYVSIEELKEKVARQGTLFGWNIGPVVTSAEELKYDAGEIDLKPENIEEKAVETLNVLSKKKASGGLDRVVIDSLSSLSMEDGTKTRRLVRVIFQGLQKLGVTAVVTSELSQESKWLSRDTISEFLVDGVVRFSKKTMGEEYSRYVVVEKLRATDINSGARTLKFTKTGITVS